MAEVGLRTVFNEAHLIFQAESFERLRVMTNDSLVGIHIKKLSCEADRLPKWEYDEWKRRTAPYLPSRDIWFKSPMSGEEMNITTRADSLAGADHDPWTDEERQTRFMAYRLETEKQDQIQLSENYMAEMASILQKMPNLRSLWISTDAEFRPYTKHITNAFWNRVGVRGPLWDEREYSPLYSTEQSCFLLRALGLASLELESLAVSPIHWQILNHGSSIKGALRKLKHLALTLMDRHKYTEIAPGHRILEIDELRRCISQGHLRDLLAAAPELETLAIHFRTSPDDFYLPLSEILNGCRWPCLRECALAYVDCSENFLAGFFKAHADTLEAISLCNMQLTRGSWSSLFQEIRSTCNSNHATIAGLRQNPEFQLAPLR